MQYLLTIITKPLLILICQCIVIVYNREDHFDVTLIQSFHFHVTPECATFIDETNSHNHHSLQYDYAHMHTHRDDKVDSDAPNVSREYPYLVVGLRDVHYLLYINCVTFAKTEVSLNANDWDHHVSFTPLALAVSHSNKYIAVATDKNMHLILKLFTNLRLKTLSSHISDDYGKPKIAWDQSDKYLYSNSQLDNNVHVYNVVTEKIIDTLEGHTGQIRDIKHHKVTRNIISISQDHSVIEWA
jgi:WD40 repeat protein